MAYWMARMFNREASRAKFRAGEIVDHLGLKEGDVVADVGSGGGYFTFLFSPRVGESGTVYAVDTNRKNLAFIKAQAARNSLGNVRIVPAEEEELDLPESGIDLVFVRNVYHHMKEPVSYFRKIRKFIRPEGKVVIIDHKESTKGGFLRLFKHYTREEDIVSALARSGYKLGETADFLPAQSFLVFEKTEGLDGV
jgi:arsenite methyltransferase